MTACLIAQPLMAGGSPRTCAPETPLVFLDFDGVLNTNAWVWSHKEGDGFDHIDPARVALVNQLLQRASAKVVVSSAWRIIFTDDELREGLAEYGFTGEIVGSTDRLGNVRGLQIQRWLTEREHAGPFVILDDSDNMAHLFPKLVRTDANHGLTQADVEKALTVLGACEPAVKEMAEALT